MIGSIGETTWTSGLGDALVSDLSVFHLLIRGLGLGGRSFVLLLLDLALGVGDLDRRGRVGVSSVGRPQWKVVVVGG